VIKWCSWACWRWDAQTNPWLACDNQRRVLNPRWVFQSLRTFSLVSSRIQENELSLGHKVRITSRIQEKQIRTSPDRTQMMGSRVRTMISWWFTPNSGSFEVISGWLLPRWNSGRLTGCGLANPPIPEQSQVSMKETRRDKWKMQPPRHGAQRRGHQPVN